jgi:Na+-transporting NADH:ubiquinone oxidoreductase subunit NqrC
MMRALFIVLVLLLTVSVVYAKDKDRLKNKGLDSQVQDVKRKMLSIAKELDRLEKRLLYPSHTQLSVFVSLRKKQAFRLDSIDVELDGKKVAYHLYSDREVEALDLGGVQRIYTGNVSIGTHNLKVTMRGVDANGEKMRLVKDFPIEKKVESKIAELMLSKGTITLISR